VLAYPGDVEPALLSQIGHLVGRVHRIVSADVAEVADVVGLEDFHDAVEVFGLMILELVTTGADRTGGGGRPQEGDLQRVLIAEVDQFLFEHPFDAVPASVDRADLRQIAGRFDQPAEAVIDDG